MNEHWKRSAFRINCRLMLAVVNNSDFPRGANLKLKLYSPDVGRHGLYFYNLWSPKRAVQELDRLAEKIKYYDRYLDLFPETKVEHLESIYRLAHALGAFNRSFLEIQLNDLAGWRGIVSGGLYALLRPSSNYRALLENVAATKHFENMWSTQCALASLSSQRWPSECRNLEYSIETLRNAIDRLRVRNTPIRRDLSDGEQDGFAEFQSNVRQVYQRFGATKALATIQASMYYQWIVSYDTWLVQYAKREGCISLYNP